MFIRTRFGVPFLFFDDTDARDDYAVDAEWIEEDYGGEDEELLEEDEDWVMGPEGTTKIITTHPLTREKVRIIEGLGRVGAVGAAVTKYLLAHLKVKRIGGIYSQAIPFMIQLAGTEILCPINIYQVDKESIQSEESIIIVNGMVPYSDSVCYEIASTLKDFYEDFEVKEIILVDGVASKSRHDENSVKTFQVSIQKNEDPEISCLDDEATDFPEPGIILGQTAVNLQAYQNFNRRAILVESFLDIVDSSAIYHVLKHLNAQLHLNLDLTQLEEESERFAQEIEKTLSMIKARESPESRPSLPQYM